MTGNSSAIKASEVLGIFDDYMQAANSVYLDHDPGTVLMQEISKDPEALAVIFHTPGITALQ